MNSLETNPSADHRPLHPANRVAVAFIHMYQHSLGRLIGGQCRFYPTCSAYGIEAFERLPFFTALGKTVWRILRCNPLSRGYHDPVSPDASKPCHHSHQEC